MKVLQLGGAFHQSFFIDELILNNYYVECLDNIPINPGHNYAKISHNISITDIENIKKIIRNEKFIVSSYGSDIAELSRNLIIGDKGKHINLLKKLSARRLLKKVFIDQKQPNIKIANLNENYQKNYCVIKPNISSGSKGISLVTSPQKIKNAIKKAQEFSIDGVAIIEEYIKNDGNKYYCEGLLIKNNLYLVIGCSKSSSGTIKWDGSVQITEDNISSFTNLSYAYLENLLMDSILKMSSAITRSSFAFNIDFYINDEKIIIIEFATRPGGNLLPLVLEHRYGINHSLSYLSILEGCPEVIYRNTPVFKIDSKKPITISIIKYIFMKELELHKEDNMIILKRKYSDKGNSEKLAALIHGT